jgi:hypothetical protein
MKLPRKWLTYTVNTVALVMLITSAAFANTLFNINIDDPERSFVEGPHVIYKKGKVYVKNVNFDKERTNVQVMTFASKDLISPLEVKVDNLSRTSFRVPLMKNHEEPATTYKQPKKMYVISDIEGNFDIFSLSLMGNGVINKDLDWTYGKGHLVLVGDFFDRGYNVTPVLWLIYKLEQEAKAAGGMVHFVLGNHEEMNMRGDVRYVKEKYIIAAKELDVKYEFLYSEHTELGRWLRSKNVVEKIGKTIFVHGGISPEMATSRVRLEEMNKYARQNFGSDKYQMRSRGGSSNAVYSKIGPMWYRGYFREHLTDNEVKGIMDLYGAKRVVVGHTIVPSISSLYGGKVLAIDVKHDVALSRRIANALLFIDDEIFAVNVRGDREPIEEFMTEDMVVKTFHAIKTGDENILSNFLGSGKDRINKYYFEHRITLLSESIRHNKPDLVELLLEHKADVDMVVDNMTPLMLAIQIGEQEIINLLIKDGANINALNKQRRTPLFYCAKYGDKEIAEFLIKNGAKLDIKDKKGRTPAQYAFECDNEQVAIYLKSLDE